MIEEDFVEKSKGLIEKMYKEVSESIAKYAYECCLICEDKLECWSNPEQGMSNTISAFIKVLDKEVARVTSMATIKLLKLIRKKQMEEEK